MICLHGWVKEEEEEEETRRLEGEPRAVQGESENCGVDLPSAVQSERRAESPTVGGRIVRSKGSLSTVSKKMQQRSLNRDVKGYVERHIGSLEGNHTLCSQGVSRGWWGRACGFSTVFLNKDTDGCVGVSRR